LENVAAASLAAHLQGTSLGHIRQALLTYQPLPHHLALVHQLNDIQFYDDSFATIPEAAVAALASFDQPLVAIVGGSDKSSDYTPLVESLANYPQLRGVIAIGQTGPIIATQLQKLTQSLPIIINLVTMTEMVAAAVQLLDGQGVVLLSPGAASFGLFKDYKDRGNQFIAAAKEVGL
jgi:UDP-N-acetylmuramoylalanine--D-glutamate ligase